MRNNNCKMQKRHLDNEVFIIDRFEGDYAVCERVKTDQLKECYTYKPAADGDKKKSVPEYVNIPKSRIDARAGEGAIVVFDRAGDLYVYDAEATSRRKEYIKSLAANLWD